MKVVNILIASVGGQGGLTLSRVIAIAAVMEGYSVRTGETLGMAQRFGSVVSYVRVGKEVNSPTFGYGEANYILGLELTEVLRNVQYLSRDGKVITADVVKPPISSSLGIAKRLYESDILNELTNQVKNLIIIPAKELAIEAGNVRAMNMVILGAFNALAKMFSEESITKAIITLLPGKKGKTSINAYKLGYEYVVRNVRSKG